MGTFFAGRIYGNGISIGSVGRVQGIHRKRTNCGIERIARPTENGVVRVFDAACLGTSCQREGAEHMGSVVMVGLEMR